MVNCVPFYELTILLSFLKVTYFIADFSKRVCTCVCMCTSVFDVCMVRMLCAYAYTASYNYKITGTISINRLNFDTFFSRSKNRQSQINRIECSIVIEC